MNFLFDHYICVWIGLFIDLLTAFLKHTAMCIKKQIHHIVDVCLNTLVCNAVYNACLLNVVVVVVVVVDPTPPTCCQQSPAPEIMWQPAVSPPRWQGKAPLCRDSSRGPG